MKKNRNFDYIIVSGTTIISALISFLYNIVIRRYIPPYDYGIFTTANLLLAYSTYFQLGTLNSYNRDYPQLVGAQNEETANYNKNVVASFMLLVYLLVCGIVIAIVISAWLNERIETKLAIGFLTTSIVAVFTIFASFMDSTLKAEGKFRYTSYLSIVKIVSTCAIGLLFVKRIGVYALFLSSFISVLIIILINGKFFVKLKWKYDIKLIGNMIRSGSPLVINGVAWTVMMSIDQFIILRFLTMEDLGAYSIGLLGFSTLVLIPQSISQIFYIKMSIKFGKTKNREILINDCLEYTRILSLITAITAVGAFIVLPIFIRVVMPAYTKGIGAAQILIIGVALYATSILFSNVLNILKMNYRLLISTMIVCGANFILSTSFVLFNRSLNSVALGTSISYALYSLVLITIISKELNQSFSKFMLTSWFPLLFLFVGCISCYAFISVLWMKIILICIIFILTIFLFYRDLLLKLFDYAK